MRYLLQQEGEVKKRERESERERERESSNKKNFSENIFCWTNHKSIKFHLKHPHLKQKHLTFA